MPLLVLDLPQLYAKPTASQLLSTLEDLSFEPRSWDTTPRSGTPRSASSGASTPFRPKRRVKREGVPRYLTSIISSPLGWIEDDEQKEQVWDVASKRLTERSGRSAMGALSRSFVIALQSSTSMSLAGDRHPSHAAGRAAVTTEPNECIELTLHEPALTSDNLGFKTWASSYLLANRLCILRDDSLPSLPRSAIVLELGAGTGLVGLAAAAVFGRRTILTDLPEIVPNLEANAEANALLLAAFDAKVDVAVLDWSNPNSFTYGHNRQGEAQCAPGMADLILAADPIYSPDHPRLLTQAIAYHLRCSSDARVVIEMPLREAYGPERDDLRAQMKAIGLVLLEDGEENGYDDWSSGNDEDLIEVHCWWSVWGRA